MKTKRDFLVLMIIAVVVITVFTSTAAEAAQKERKLEERKGEIRHIEEAQDGWVGFPDWLKMGAYLRLRSVYDNNRGLDKNAAGHDRYNLRYRARVWARILLSEDVDFNIRLMTEPRYNFRPDLDHPFTRNEGLFDRFNVTLRNAFDLPLTATVGRQDLWLGSGWLIIDGTPLDGGRSGYFDALRFTYDLKDNTTADLIWVENHANTSEWIRPFNDENFDISEQDEQGLILYLSNKSLDQTRFDGYFLYKREHDRRRATGTEGETYTIGSFIHSDIDDHWQSCVELAAQFGHKNGKDLSGFATNSWLAYHFNDEKKNSIQFGYEYLSGSDDPDKYFDRVWGRLDQWSRIYTGPIDSIDGRAYDSSNLHRFVVNWISNPTRKTELDTSYHMLFADENPSTGGTGGLSKSGCFRGQLLRGQLKYRVNKNFYHRAEAELFFPGDFYNDERNDVAVFLRYEIIFTW